MIVDGFRVPLEVALPISLGRLKNTLKRSPVAGHFRHFVAREIECDLSEMGWIERCRQIRKEVCAKYGITLTQMDSNRRALDVMQPRREAMSRCLHETGLSSPQVGKVFNRDRTTVMDAAGLTKRSRSLAAKRKERVA